MISSTLVAKENNKVEVIMVLESSSLIKGKVLDPENDSKLQSIVTKASEVSGFPVALITLILKRTQVYRAHVGLPPKLAAYRGIDSCLSFCQYVVNTKKPLKIFDATQEPALPQQLVELYGIRAYYGYPVLIDNVVVGSLCIVDKKPNTITEEVEQTLIQLAKEASVRLMELASNKSNLKSPEAKLNPAQQNIWNGIRAARDEIQLAIVDLYPVVKAMSTPNEDGEDGPELNLAQSLLTDATKAYEDLNAGLAHLDRHLEKLSRS